jgi:subtilisin family serine protease
MARLVALLLGLLAGLLGGGAPALAASVVADAVREAVQRDGQARVLVRFGLAGTPHVPEGRLASPAAAAAQRQAIAQGRAQLLGRIAGSAHREVRAFQTVPLVALEVGPAALAMLEAATPLVERVLEDRLHQPVLAESVPLIGADLARARGFDGTGFVVAVLDSGVEAGHPFLAGRVVEEACYSTNSGNRSRTLCPNGREEQTGPGAAAPCDLEGCWHGTHVAGIVAGNGAPAGQPFSGVAPGAAIMAVQVFSRFDGFFDCGGAPPCALAYTSDILAGLERVYLLRTVHAFAAVNMSIGGGLFSAPCDDQPYKPIIDSLRAAGIPAVVASGNSGAVDQISAPACVSTAVSVGATTKDDQVAWFSNVAPFLSLLAPGDAILSSVTGGLFGIASGTSMAAPHVAGAWAVLRHARPEAGVDEALAALRDTGLAVVDERAGTGTAVPRIRVDLAAEVLRHPGAPVVAAIRPDRASRGTSMAVTLGGFNFQPGATVSFGAGTTVSDVAVLGPTALTATVTVAATAALGPRDVTVANPGGAEYVKAAAFTVLPPPPTLSLTWVGRVRDRVGKASAALAADGTLDGTFRVALGAGSGPRTVTRLDLRRTGDSAIWDTLPSTIYWALGAAAGLDSGLVNAADASLSYPVPDGGGVHVFASDLSPTPFAPGAGFVLTADFADGTRATASLALPQALLTVSGLNPGGAVRGAAVTVTLTGGGFAPGATVSFGAGIVVEGVTVQSSTQLSAALRIDAAAALGPRDVTVVNPDSQTAILPGGFTVTPPAPAVSLAWVGKTQDRVGPANAGVAPDGALDGVLTVSLGAGSGPRTVTRLELRRNGGDAIWDTLPGSSYWALGAAATATGSLLNAPDASVTFPVADGGSFAVFASEFSPAPFTGGNTLTLTMALADGSTATATVAIPVPLTLAAVAPTSGTRGTTLDLVLSGSGFGPGATVALGPDVTVLGVTVGSSSQLVARISIAAAAALGPRDVTVALPDGQSRTLTGGFAILPPPPTLGMSWAGRTRDAVGAGATALAPDGALDGVFRVSLQAGSGARTVTRLELKRSDGAAIWDTAPATSYWVLGAAAAADGPLANAADGSVAFAVADGGGFHVFASEHGPAPFAAGSSFTVTADFADGTRASASVTIPSPPPATLALAWLGRARDAVGPGNTVMSPDGALDGSFRVTLQAGSGPRTVTRIELRRGDGGGIWDSVFATSYWVLGAAGALDGPLLNASNAAVSFPVPDGGVFHVFASDASPGLFAPGKSFALTVAFSDGTTATAGVTIAVPPPPVMSAGWLGRVRDRVGQGSTALAPDGRLDGVFSLTLGAGSGERVITFLELGRTAGGLWDTSWTTGAWALGAARSLDGALLNGGNASVAFSLAEGATVQLFAADTATTLFGSGSTFTIRVGLADGSSASVTVTLP